MQATEPTSLLQQAEARVRARDLAGADALCVEALKLAPGSAQAWFLISVIASLRGDHPRAVTLAERAVGLGPARSDHLAHLSISLARVQRLADARATAARAAAVAADDPAALDLTASLYVALEDPQAALGLQARAADLAPGSADFSCNHATTLAMLGRPDEAAVAYRKSVAADPGHHRAWHGLAEVERQRPEANIVAELEAQFAKGGPAQRQLHLGHALAKAFEDLGDYPRALEWLARAKAGMRAAAPFDAVADRQLFDAAADLAETWPALEGDDSAAPIFVVGMPRSGTTLAERIISSHPDVRSLGESPALAAAIKRLTRTGGGLFVDLPTLQAVRAQPPAAIGAGYLELTGEPTAGAPRQIDKMPFNVLYAGVIARALPQARIVCLRRDPMDTCVANYRQLLASNQPIYSYAYDLAATAQRYAGFERLVGRLRAALPADRFMELSYEALVADQEGQSRRLLDFCALAWDDRCLAFHENPAPVRTASLLQVRQPIHAGSVGRWRRYGAGLAPLEQALRDEGVIA